MGKQVIRNAKGEAVTLNKRETMLAQYNQSICNALGYEVDITTLTTVVKAVTEQKFFSVVPSEYMPVVVGNGAWGSSLLTYRSFVLGGEFEEGIINTAGENGRLAMANTGVDALSINIYNWAKGIGYTLFDIELAQKSGNWDLVSAKEEGRKTNWDLGIQRVAFLGARGTPGCLGLLNQAGISANVAVITKAIKTMTPDELKAFLAAIIPAYRLRCNYTAWPTHFIIPEDDYTGLASQASADFPVLSTLQLLENAFKTVCRQPNFKILPLAYATPANSGGVLTYPRYTLLNYDPKSIRMDIPVDYTNTLANSIDNFTFQNVGYAQFTGVLAYRLPELMYFDINL